MTPSTTRPASGADRGDARITAVQQQSRDKDRRQILEAELRREQETLDRMRRNGPADRDPAAVLRTQENIIALSRELGRTPALAAAP